MTLSPARENHRGMTIFTIGFTKKSAERFFTLLRQAGVQRVLDIRVHNNSQLAGFAKKDDLAFFLRELGGIVYQPMPELAPTPEMMEGYRKDRDWPRYEREYLRLIKGRRAEKALAPEMLDGGCLLCSESEPDHCHRRLAAEYLRDRFPGLAIRHLT